MPMAAPPMAPNSLVFVELGLSAMDGTALCDEDKLRMIGLLSSFTLSEARMAYGARRAATEAEASQNADMRGFEGLLRLLVDKTTYPRLHRIAWASIATNQSPDEHEMFLAGVDCILDGIQALIGRSNFKQDQPQQELP